MNRINERIGKQKNRYTDRKRREEIEREGKKNE